MSLYLGAAVYLAFSFAVSAGYAMVPHRRSIYFYYYMGSTLTSLLIDMLVMRELYHHALTPHPGIARAARYAIYGGVGLAAAATLGTIGLDLANPAEKYPLLRILLAVERGALSILVLFLLVFTAFLAWFPVQVRRNLVYYWAGYAALFLGQAGLLLARNRIGAEFTVTANILQSILWIGCMLFWFLRLRREGEELSVETGHAWNPAEADRLRSQLEQINDALMKRN
jgi:hypothetical protein